VNFAAFRASDRFPRFDSFLFLFLFPLDLADNVIFSGAANFESKICGTGEKEKRRIFYDRT